MLMMIFAAKPICDDEIHSVERFSNLVVNHTLCTRSNRRPFPCQSHGAATFSSPWDFKLGGSADLRMVLNCVSVSKYNLAVTIDS